MASGRSAPHPKAEHMAAPTSSAELKNILANGEPSTQGRVLPEPTRQRPDIGFTADKRTQPTVKMGGERTLDQDLALATCWVRLVDDHPTPCAVLSVQCG